MLSGRFFAIACALLVCPVFVRAQATVAWANANSDFTKPTSWVGGTLTNSTTSDITDFSTSTPTVQPTVSSPFSVAGVQFDPGAGAFNLTGTAPLTIGSNGIQNHSASVRQTIAVPVIVGGVLGSIFNQGSLSLSGGITNNAASGLTLDGPGLGGEISGVITGTGGVVKKGPGVWVLDGDNDYTGPTTLNSGTLSIRSDSGLGSAPTVATPGALTFNGGILETTGSFTLNAHRGILVGAGGATIQTDPGTTLTYQGKIDAPAGTQFNKSGSGTLALGGANDYAGGTNVLAGELTDLVAGAFSPYSPVSVAFGAALHVNGNETIAGLNDNLGSGGSVTIGSGAVLTDAGSGLFSGTISGGGALVTSGAGQVLGGANSYGGGTTISSGTLVATNTSGSATGSGPITIANGAKLQLGNNGAGGSVSGDITDNGNVVFASTDITSYSGVISGTGGLQLGSTGGLTLTGANTYSGATTIGSGTLVVGAPNTLPSGTIVTLGNSGVLEVQHDQSVAELDGLSGAAVQLGNATFTIAPAATANGGSFSGRITGAGSLVIAGGPGSVMTLTGANGYAGGTTLSGTALNVGNDSALGSGTLTVAGNSTVTGPHAALVPTGAVRTLANAVSLGTSNLDVGGSVDLALGGALTGASSSGLFKVGAGNLVLSGDNTGFAGTTTIQEGSVTYDSAAAVGAGPLEFTGTSPVSATFLGNGQVGGISGGTSATINLGSGTTFDVHQTFNSTFNGTITGASGGVTFENTGATTPVALRLGGASTYTGQTTLGSGVVVVAGNGGALGNVTNRVTLAGGELDAGAGVTVANPITISSGGALGGSGTFKPPAGPVGLAIGNGVALNPGGGGPGGVGNLTFDGSLLSTSVLLLNSGGTYDWQLVDAADASSGWDRVTVNGTVSIGATTAAPFNFTLSSVQTEGSPFSAANFNPAQAYSWPLLTATNILGFLNSNQFRIDSTGFLNANGGVFSLGLSGHTLVLNFTPVPEPSTYALLLAGLAVTYVAFRRRRRRTA